MIALIVFGIIFLVGFALLIALLGTSFLKRHGVRMPSRAQPSMYRRESESAAEPARQAAPSHSIESDFPTPVQQPETPPPMPKLPPQRFSQGVSSTGSKWAFIIPVIVVAVVVLLLFGVGEFVGGPEQPRLYFCEDVDYVKAKPIRHSDTFTRGNVMLFLKSKTPLYLDKARVEVYRLDTEDFEPFLEKELRLKPEWESFSVKALFGTVGQYSVYVYGNSDEPIVRKNITIVPDSYGYRPVREL